jgi:hypothetical protein
MSNNVSTLVNKHKLHLIKVIVGCHLHKKSDIETTMFDKIKHGYPPNFDISQYFVAFCFHDFYQFGKFQMFLGAIVEINIDTLQRLSM